MAKTYRKNNRESSAPKLTREQRLELQRRDVDRRMKHFIRGVDNRHIRVGKLGMAILTAYARNGGFSSE